METTRATGAAVIGENGCSANRPSGAGAVPPARRCSSAAPCSLLSGPDEPALVGDHHELGAVAGVELAEEAADVGASGVGADVQDASDLGVRATGSDLGEDVALTVGE